MADDVKSKKKMRLTQRDLYLLSWVNSVGFVTIEHIAVQLKVAISTAYIRARKLVSSGYLTHHRVFHGTKGVYKLARQGLFVCGSQLPIRNKIPLATYHHDLLVTTLSQKLVQRLGGDYIPERELRHREGLEAFGKAGTTPDSVLILDDKRIAIEVELNRKEKRRREKIFAYYAKNFSYHEVWYFCGSADIARQIKPFAEKMPFVRIKQFNEFLGIKEGENERIIEV